MDNLFSRVAEALGFRSRLTTNRLRSRPGVRLRLEGLEARDVPAFWVTNGGDSGPGTLRQAIIDAQGILADNDEIIIAEEVGAIVLASPLPTLLETHTIRAEFTGATAAHVLITPETGLENTFRCMRVTPNGATLTLRNIDFDGFGAVDDGTVGSGDGGAISADGPLDLAYCNFTNCTATGNGGAIALGRSLTLDTCVFTGNVATGNGGAIWEVSTIAAPIWDITDSNFSWNAAGGSGGAIYLHTGSAGQLICHETPFSGNTAGGNGGAIYQSSGFLEVTDASSMGGPGGFIGNTAAGLGGAIYIFDASSIYFDAFADGNFDQYGGGPPRSNTLFIKAPRPGIPIYINYDRISEGVDGVIIEL